jgi:hypothetical protein
MPTWCGCSGAPIADGQIRAWRPTSCWSKERDALGKTLYLRDAVEDIGASRHAEALNKAVALAQELPHVLIVSASDVGVPHLAPARQLTLAPGGRVTVTEWFCRTTVTNVQRNDHVAIVVWDSKADAGYQLVGRVEEMLDLDTIDGFVLGEGASTSLPQTARELVVHVTTVLRFTGGPHSDVPERSPAV